MPTVSTFNRKRKNINKIRRIKLKVRKSVVKRLIPATTVRQTKKYKSHAMKLAPRVANKPAKEQAKAPEKTTAAMVTK